MPHKRFAILSGPSCVGKGPLVAALKRFHTDLEYVEIPVIKSRESRPKGPRPEERDLWDKTDFFRWSEEILGLVNNRQYLVGDCRGLPQAVDLAKVQEAKANLLFIEVYHTIGVQLRASTFLKDVEVVTIFLSPVGIQEILDLRCAGVALEDYLTNLMLHKQLVRDRYQGKPLDHRTIEDARARATDTLAELRSACNYSHVIVNRDGEGNPNWHRLPSGAFAMRPEGDAGRALDALHRTLGGSAAAVENWSSLQLQL